MRIIDLESTEFLLTQSTGLLSKPCAEFLFMGERHERLIAAREDAGFRSARQAALRFHWKPSTYASHENGQTPLPSKAAQQYAKAYKVSAAWLLTGEGEKRRRVTVIRGKVGAGGEVFPPTDDLGDEIDLPPGAPLNAAAVVVDGNSMYPRYFPGEHVFYIDERRPAAELIGQECVVKLADGRLMIKMLQSGSRPKRFTLESWNAPPLYNRAIEWAAPVRWTARGGTPKR